MSMRIRNIGFLPSSVRPAVIWAFFLVDFLRGGVAGVLNVDRRHSEPLVLSITNVTFQDGITMNRGIQIILGDQIQGLRMSTILNNTRIRNILDCSTRNDTARSGCGASSGGVHSTTRGTFIHVPDGKDWDVAVIDPEPADGTTILRGYVVGNFTDGPAFVPDFPLEVWANSNALNKSALALGPSSSVLKRLQDSGIIPSRTFGMDYGSRSELFPHDGQLVLGGFDEVRYDPHTRAEFPMWGAAVTADCPLQVLVTDVILTNESGNHTLFVDPDTEVSACIDPIQNAFTFTPSMFARWQQLTHHIDYDGSSYGQQSYPLDREPLMGTLTIKLANGYVTTIPHYELLSHERGSDAQGKYAVTNSSRIMAAVQSGQSDLGNNVPILGGVFLSQNYLHVDYSANTFSLSPRIKDAAPPDRIYSISVNQMHAVGRSCDLGLKAGLSVAIVILVIGGFQAWSCTRRWLPHVRALVRTHQHEAERLRYGGRAGPVEMEARGKTLEFLTKAEACSRMNRSPRMQPGTSQAFTPFPNDKVSYPNIQASADILGPNNKTTATNASVLTLPHLVDIIFRAFPFLAFEQAVPKGKVRARWICHCGEVVYDDYTEVEPGSVQQLQEESRTSTMRSTTHRQMVFAGSRGLIGNFRQNIYGLITSIYNTKPGQGLPVSGRNPYLSQASSVTAQTGTASQNTLLLLLCIDKRVSTTSLHQERVGYISTDRQLFTFLRSEYYRHWNARPWFTLRTIRRLSHTRFSVDMSGFVDIHSHDKACGSGCVCLPPRDKMDTEYCCNPAPEIEAKYVPAIGPNRLKHYFIHPDALDPSQKTILSQLPKRSCGRLAASGEQDVIGWGLHFEQGWHWRTIYCLVALTVLSSLIIGTIWSIVKGDIQGGFAVSGYGIALGSLVLGYMACRD